MTKAQNSVDNAQVALDQAKQSLTNYEIRAPFDGTIRQIDFKVGDNLATNSSATTEYVYVQNPDLIQVDVLLDQTQIVKVQPGMKATLSFFSYPNQTFNATVTLIPGVPVTSNGVTSYNARMMIDAKGTVFYTGMTDNVSIILTEKDGVIVIPTIDVQTSTGSIGSGSRRSRGGSGGYSSGSTGSGGGGSYSRSGSGSSGSDTNSGSRSGRNSGSSRNYVNVVNPDGTTTKRPIVTGIVSGDTTEVVSGLQVGEQIAEKSYTTNKAGSGSTSIFSSLRLPGVGGGGGG